LKFLSEFEQILPLYNKSGLIQKSIDSYIHQDNPHGYQRYQYLDFITFLIKLDKNFKKLINLDQYIWIINKILKI